MQPISLKKLPDQPLVSVLIANYNYATYIGEAIESVLNQTYPNLEIIIADDGSTDDSCSIVERYVRQDTRVKLLRECHRGNGAALNTAFAASTGQIFCLLDSDDLFVPDRVEKIVNQFKTHPNVGLVVHSQMIVDQFGHDIYPLLFKTRIEHGWIADRVIRRGGRWANMPGGGTCFRREVAERIFPMPEDKFPIYGDGFIYTMGPLLTEVSALTEPLYKARLHGQNTYGSLKRDVNTVRKEMKGIALQVAETNRRLETLGLGANLLDISRNLNYRQQRFSLFLFEGRPPHIMMKEYAAFARAFMQDDLYVPGQKLIRLLVYGLAVLLPSGWRCRWLIAAGSRNRLRPLIESGINRLGMLPR